VYNDVLKCNYQVGLSLIENDSVNLSSEDILFLLNRHGNVDYPSFIQDAFRGIYYTLPLTSPNIVKPLQEKQNKNKLVINSRTNQISSPINKRI